MQEAHSGVLRAAGERVDNRADSHLNHAAAHGHHHSGNGQARKGPGQQPGQDSQQDKPSCTADMGKNCSGPVAYPIHKADAEHIHQNLGDEVKENQGGEHGIRDAEFPLKDDKEQGAEVVDHALDYVAAIAGHAGGAV